MTTHLDSLDTNLVGVLGAGEATTALVQLVNKNVAPQEKHSKHQLLIFEHRDPNQTRAVCVATQELDPAHRERCYSDY